jgi:membrane protease YdiL (CAAX protease family)
MAHLNGWVNRHPLSAYFFVAYALSWSIAIPLALQAQGVLGTHLPWALHYLTAFGPAAAALIVARILREPLGTDLPARRAAFSRRALWWTIGFGSPLLLFVVAQVAAGVAGQPVPRWISLGRVNFLPDLGLAAWLLWFMTSGSGEELGWRGFALPRLQRTRSAVTSSLLLAIGWAGWHLPAFFYVPSYTAMGLRILPGFFLGVLAGAIVLTWLYNSSRGSVLAAVLWHASFNFVTASPNAGGLAAAVTSSLVMVWAFAVLWRYDWKTLATPRGRARSVRASVEEKTRALSGDELIPHPLASLTHAITLRCGRAKVWPWLVQMGAGSRAGWYSYDFLDNGRTPSAVNIVPSLQHLSVGMVLPALPGATDAFTVLAFEPERFLIVGWLSPDGTRLMTWAFILEEAGPDSTRLIVRARAGSGYQFHRLPSWLADRIVPIVHFVMQRRQLLGIAARAESSPAGGVDRIPRANQTAA